MADDVTTLQSRVKSLEAARDQLSKEWLEVEREKTLLAAAIEHLAIGFIAVDDYKNITIKNQAADKILGESKAEQWTVDEIQQRLEGVYDLVGNIDRCFQQRLQIEPVDVEFEEKKMRIFISPIIILRRSITVPMVVILLEELAVSSAVVGLPGTS
jgi:nitrogen fixation/metabolism regulation signal transduction histidine kinase